MALLIGPNFYTYLPSSTSSDLTGQHHDNNPDKKSRTGLSSALANVLEYPTWNYGSRQLWQDSSDLHVSEDDKKYSVAIEVPGVKQQDMNMQLVDNGRVLHFNATRKVKQGADTYDKTVERRVMVGEDVDVNQISASVEDGVLYVTLVKIAKEVSGTRSIPIQHGATQAAAKAIDDGNKDGTYSYSFAIEVPGIKPDDMKMQLEEDGRVLHFTGTRKRKDGSSICEKNVERRIALGKDVDLDNIVASLEDGILDITLVRKAKKEVGVRAIPITQGSTKSITDADEKKEE